MNGLRATPARGTALDGWSGPLPAKVATTYVDLFAYVDIHASGCKSDCRNPKVVTSSSVRVQTHRPPQEATVSLLGPWEACGLHLVCSCG